MQENASRGNDNDRVAADATAGERASCHDRPMPDATPIAELPNFGPKSAELLKAVGLHTLSDLRRLGSVAAYAQAKRGGKPVSLNLLWAIEGAITGEAWQDVARLHRTSLLLALDDHERRSR